MYSGASTGYNPGFPPKGGLRDRNDGFPKLGTCNRSGSGLRPLGHRVRGSLGAHEQGLIITTSDFGKGARTEAERPDAVPVALMNGEQLVKLLVENDIGIRRTATDLIELGEAEEGE